MEEQLASFADGSIERVVRGSDNVNEMKRRIALIANLIVSQMENCMADAWEPVRVYITNEVLLTVGFNGKGAPSVIFSDYRGLFNGEHVLLSSWKKEPSKVSSLPLGFVRGVYSTLPHLFSEVWEHNKIMKVRLGRTIKHLETASYAELHR